MTEPLLQVREAELDDLRSRLRATRWPAQWPVEPWAAGTDPGELRRLVELLGRRLRLARTGGASINALPSHFATIGGHRVHYLRFDAERPARVPIVADQRLAEHLLRDGRRWRSGSPAAQPAAIADEPLHRRSCRRCPGSPSPSNDRRLPADLPTHEIWHRLMTERAGLRALRRARRRPRRRDHVASGRGASRGGARHAPHGGRQRRPTSTSRAVDRRRAAYLDRVAAVEPRRGRRTCTSSRPGR